MDLANNVVYSNMEDAFANHHSPISGCFKEPFDIKSPTILVKKPIINLWSFNYCQVTLPDSTTIGQQTIDQPKYRYYIITDIISVGQNLTEIRLKFDPIRNWRVTGSEVKLAYTNNRNYWSEIVDDTRFEPYDHGQYAGIVNKDVDMGFGSWCVSDGRNPYNSGFVLLKYWSGIHETTTDSDKGVCYYMMSYAQYDVFCKKFMDFLNDKISALFSGISDFTKFIYWAKFFPGWDLDAAFADHCGYDYCNEIIIGNWFRATVTGYIRFATAGFIRNNQINQSTYQFDIFNGLPSSGKKMKFLQNSRWCSIIIDTPMGWKPLPPDTFSYDAELKWDVVVDLETGISTITFYKRGLKLENPCSESIMDISGPVYIDVSGNIAYMTSVTERELHSAPSAAVGGVAGAKAGAAFGPYGAAVGALGGAILGGAYSEATTQRNISIVGGDSTPSLCWLRQRGMTMRRMSIKTFIYLNPETPIRDSDSPYMSSGVWSGAALHTRYFEYCDSEYHGYPSIKHATISDTIISGEPTLVRVAEIDNLVIGHWNNYDLSQPSDDDLTEIRKKLYEGIIIKPYGS